MPHVEYDNASALSRARLRTCPYPSLSSGSNYFSIGRY
jgi:hypothetical protein